MILVAASDEGITSYQYDGWRFVLTGAQADRVDTALGLGPKSLSVFYQGNQAFISKYMSLYKGSSSYKDATRPPTLNFKRLRVVKCTLANVVEII